MTSDRIARVREALAQAYERANLICQAADVRAGNKIDWVREAVVLDALSEALSFSEQRPQVEAVGEIAALREALAEAVGVLERLPYGDWPGRTYRGKVAAANGLIRHARAALTTTSGENAGAGDATLTTTTAKSEVAK